MRAELHWRNISRKVNWI